MSAGHGRRAARKSKAPAFTFAYASSRLGPGAARIGGGGGARQFGRRDKAGAREILVARRLRLPVPERLLFDLGRGQLRKAFEAQHGMSQVGDGSVAVLEIEALQELLRIVRAHPRERLAD